ncbi:LANO_0H22056g1_1 [Lachancea nothofagi CBS 11611]|uniref:5-demethoxyubiquinone hydroxylase, mitochondrial n=1 Tax=Lachancea nothofagi CBS 11611 TaxID=1266666 RepID=A0A1G4KNG0_9SACH|nr:LANO_0H22056g1_1 [Lachancea nothofagi CBS 11611]
MLHKSFAKHSCRSFSVLKKLKNLEKSPSSKVSHTHDQFKPLSEAQVAYLDRAIRVDQAGELGANYIYAGQYFVLANKHPHLKPVLQHMWDQEIHHHNTFNDLQIKRRVRPSLLTPLWKLGAFVIGSGTAIISPEAAMACTEAVETVIGGHYNDQLRCLNNQYEMDKIDGTKGQSLEIQNLVSTIKQFRDEELEHLDTAVEYDSHKAVPYIVLTEAIKAICRSAVWTAERI